MKQFFLFVFLLMLASCSSKKEKLTRVWFYDSSDFPSEEEIGKEIGFNSMEHQVNLQPYSFIDLQEDGTYSSDIGKYEWGRWYYEDGKVKLVNQQRQVLDLEVKTVNEDVAQLLHRSRGALYTFGGFSNQFKNPEDNPFAPVNNAWRIKAEEEEGSLGVSKRIRNYFQFWEKYFQWGIDIDKSSLDVRSLPGPIKMYGNGFSLIPYEKQPGKWLDQFYDASESYMAYQKLDSFFRYTNIQWKKTDNRFDMFRDAFHQARQKLPAGYTE